MNTVEKIQKIYEQNHTRETRDDIWNFCMSLIVGWEFNEQNLENMSSTPLTAGFRGTGEGGQINLLAEALGIFTITNPETGALGSASVTTMSPDQVLDKIQELLPFPINFPPFSGNCEGIQTKYGTTSNRHIFYLWVMKRIMELCPNKNASIIEIGAGFGLLGYYLDKAGYRDYTTIDLALINACQTYFLTKNLPDRKIILSGDVEDPFDPSHRDAIKLLHCSDFEDIPKNRFAIMVNMDGLTEYGVIEASKYTQSNCASILLSINCESNPFRVYDIARSNRKLAYRYPFWLRHGYVEELYV